MRTRYTFFTLLVIIYCFVGDRLFAQTEGIDSLKLLPANPTISDIVKVVCYSTFMTGDCKLDSSRVNINESEIIVSVSHVIGMLDYICHSIDTVIIGKFHMGNYVAVYNLKKNSSSKIYSDTLNFIVSAVNNVDGKREFIPPVEIYPNPFTTRATLHIGSGQSFSHAEFILYDIMGREVRREKIFKQETLIERNNLNAGIYSFKILNDDGYARFGKVVVQ